MLRSRMERHVRSKARVADHNLAKRQYSSRVQVDDTDPRITYQQSNWYAAQNMTGRGYNGTATMTKTNDSWLQLPFSGGSLTLGLLHNGVAFSGLLGVDDGTSYKFSVPVRESLANATVLTPLSFRYDHLACGNHTATLTIDVDPTNDSNATRPEVYFDWFSYPLPSNEECPAADEKSTGSSTPSGALNLNAAPPELKTVAITLASMVAGIFILGILACLLRHRRQKYERKKRGILGLHHASRSIFDPASTDEPTLPVVNATVKTNDNQRHEKGNECPVRPSRPDNVGLSAQDCRQIDAAIQPLSVFHSTSTEAPVEIKQKRSSWWSLSKGKGKARFSPRPSLDATRRAGTPNFSLPTSLQPKPKENVGAGDVSFESAELALGPRTSHLAYLQTETPSTASMSFSAMTATTPLRPRTAPERLVKYTSGSRDVEVMFELVDSRDALKRRAGISLPARPRTAHSVMRKPVREEERPRMPSLDTQWSRASATDAHVMLDNSGPVLARLIDDYVPSQHDTSATADHNSVILARLLDDYVPNHPTDVENSVETLAPPVAQREIMTPPPSASPTSRARSPCTPPRPLKSSKRKRLDLDPDTDTMEYQSFAARFDS